MNRSFQNEIPKARVNIALELETGEGLQKKELPLKLLAMGNYSHGKTKGPLAKRDRINIHKNNLNDVLNDLNPSLNLVVENKLEKSVDDLSVNLSFKHYQDFHPKNIARQVPMINRLLAMRNLLKDLKSNLADDTKIRREMSKLFENKSAVAAMHQELNQLMQEKSKELAHE